MASQRKTAARRGTRKAARPKKAAGRKTAVRKTGARKTAAKKKTRARRAGVVEPKASGTLGISGTRSRSGMRDFDFGSKPPATLGGTTRAAKAAMPATLGGAVRESLAVDAATRIVRAAADGYTGSIEDTLEEAGLSTPNLRELFRAGVRDGVVAAGYHIDPLSIPNGPTVRLSTVRKAVLVEAR